MRTTLFNISLEDDIIAASDPTEGTDINVTEVIEQQSAQSEIGELTNKVDAINETIEEAIDVIEELQEQVAENEEKLEESPEEITPDDVQASQEAFQIKLSALGMSHDEICVNRISVESMVNNTKQSLRISTEDIKETIKKIWEKIKRFFVRIIEHVKILWDKIFKNIDSLLEQTEKLNNKLQSLKNEKINMTHDEKNTFTNNFPNLCLFKELDFTFVKIFETFTGYSERDIEQRKKCFDIYCKFAYFSNQPKNSEGYINSFDGVNGCHIVFLDKENGKVVNSKTAMEVKDNNITKLYTDCKSLASDFDEFRKKCANKNVFEKIKNEAEKDIKNLNAEIEKQNNISENDDMKIVNDIRLKVYFAQNIPKNAFNIIRLSNLYVKKLLDYAGEKKEDKEDKKDDEKK